MANQLPCPNPACSHVFSPAEIQAGTAVKCPKCGFRVKGSPGPAAKPPTRPAVPGKAVDKVPVARPATPSAKAAVPGKPAPGPAPAKPPAKPAAKIAPIAKPAPKARPAVPVAPVAPVAPVVPLAKPVAVPGTTIGPDDIDVELVDAPPAAVPPPEDLPAGDGPLVKPRTYRRKFRLGRMLVILFVLMFSLGVVGGGGYYLITHFEGGLRNVLNPGGPSGKTLVGQLRNLKGADEKVFRLALPAGKWTVHKDVRSQFKAIAAYQKDDEDVWFAVVAQDHGMQRARDAELVGVAVEKLEGYFGTDVELKKPAPATFGGVSGQRIEFKGQSNAALWAGECYTFFKDGFGYWVFIASPDREVAQRYAAELGKEDTGFSPVTERRGWREQPPPMKTFTSANGFLTVSAPEGVWTKGDAKNEDERGELLLSGFYLKEKDNRKNATVLVATMDRAKDLAEAMKTARADLEAKKKQELADYRLSQAEDVAAGQSELGELQDVGNRRGRVADLRLHVGDDPKGRYILLAVVNEADMAYVIRCGCAWEYRQIWRQDFRDLLATFRFKKGE